MTETHDCRSSTKSQVLVIAGDLATIALLFHFLARTPPSLLDLGAGAATLSLYRHGAPRVWRRLSVLFFALIFGGLAAFLSAQLGDAIGLRSAWIASPLAFFLLPLPGHLLAALPRRRDIPLRLKTSRAQKLFASRWFRSGGHPFRPARTTEESESAELDSPHLYDLETRILTSKGSYPFHPEAPTRGMSLIVKRTLDIIASLSVLPLVLPLTIVAGLAVLLNMGRPVFYSQIRVTSARRLFRIWKIRTMIQDAEPDGVAVWPQDHDPRITRLGGVLRRLWIDELPQLMNVIRGDMSLVGPRPERLNFVQDFEMALPTYHLRCQVAAGMTGLAQVRGLIGNTSIARRLRKDLRYILLWSPGMDLFLLGATVCQVSRRLMMGFRRRPR